MIAFNPSTLRQVDFSEFKASLGQPGDLVSKQGGGGAEGVAQLVECLPSSHKAVGFIPSIAQNWTWWHTSTISLRQEFKANLSYMRTCDKNPPKSKNMLKKISSSLEVHDTTPE